MQCARHAGLYGSMQYNCQSGNAHVMKEAIISIQTFHLCVMLRIFSWISMSKPPSSHNSNLCCVPVYWQQEDLASYEAKFTKDKSWTYMLQLVMLFLLLYYLCRFSPLPPGSILVDLSSVWTQLSAICGPHASSVAPMVTHIFQILLSCLTHRNVHAHTQTHTGTRTWHTDTHHVNKRASMLGSKKQALWACHQSQWSDSQGKRKHKWDFIGLTRVHNVKTKVICVSVALLEKETR